MGPNLCVSMRVETLEEYNEKRDAVDQKLIQFIISAGFTPVLLPNTMIDQSNSTTLLEAWVDRFDIKGILLSGGGDVGGDSDRDITETEILRIAARRKLPALGICRGMQMMAVFAGGVELVAVDGHINSCHEILVQNSLEPFPKKVNSYHKYAISGCPIGFRILANASDGVIEAIQSIDLIWEGWMWHPERNLPFDLFDIKRFRSLFKGCE